MIVTIIGAGMMGSALAFPARENGNEVRLVGTPLDEEIIDACKKENKHPKFDKKFPDGVRFFQFDEAEEAKKGADFIIGGVSSFGVEWFLKEVLEKTAPGVPVLSVTKGLIEDEDGALISYPEYWEKELAKKSVRREICAIGGPCTSYELVAHDKSEVAFCGKDEKTLRKMKEALATNYYFISLTKDVHGLEYAVALKNAYALAVAMTIGLYERETGKIGELHYNSQAGAFFQTVKEMRALLRAEGANENSENIGVGDLYVTVYGGRTRKIGILLGRGLSYEEAMREMNGVTLESLVITRRLTKNLRERAERGEIDVRNYPLVSSVGNVLDYGEEARLPWDAFTFEEL